MSKLFRKLSTIMIVLVMCAGVQGTAELAFAAQPASGQGSLAAAASNIASGTCGSGLTWTLDSAYKLSITGDGYMDDYTYDTTPWYKYKDKVKSISIGNKVRWIGDYAFYYMRNVTSPVTIPASVEHIGIRAFYCYNPTSITFNEGLREIGNCAFAESNLTSVVLPSTLYSIGDEAFRYQSWYSSTKNPLKSVTIKNGLKIIGEYAFFGCNSLTSITIPQSVNEIGGRAFEYCTSLTIVSFSEGLERIGDYAFESCTKLARMTLPQSVTSIGESAFWGCAFTSIAIPQKCYEIGANAFTYCRSLKSADLGVAYVGKEAFRECENLESVTIGGDVGERAFASCTSLKQITFANDGRGGTIWIGKSAFENCAQLETVTMPMTLSSLEDRAFADCANLHTVFFPNSIFGATYIPNSCFAGDSVTAFYPSEEIKSSNLLEDTWDIARARNYEGIQEWLPSEVLHEGTCGQGVNWSYDNVGTLVVSGLGAMANYGSADDQPWADLRGQITSVVIKDGVTSIGDWSLAQCPLRLLSIGGSATRVGDSAMRGATALHLEIPGSVRTVGEYAFSEIGNLDSATLAEGVVTLGAHAFANCQKMCRVNLPDTLQTIGDGAFADCRKLSSVSIPDSVRALGAEAFASCQSITELQLPAGLATLGNRAFGNCGGLKSVAFLGGAPSIGVECFLNDKLTAYYSSADASWASSVRQQYGGTVTWKANDVVLEGTCGDSLSFTLDNLGNLVIVGYGPMYDFTAGKGDGYDKQLPWADFQGTVRSVSLPSGLTSIGAHAFIEFNKLKNVALPEGLTSIGEAAFEGCSSLEKIAIPSNVSTIGAAAFNRCSTLAEVTLPDGIDQIADNLFCQCSRLRTVHIPNGVSRIGDWAFEYCTSLAAVSIPATVTEIGKFAFSDNHSLREVAIPDGVTKIGPYAFYFCTSLERIAIGDGLTTLEEAVLHGCSALREVELPDSLTAIGPWALNRCTSLESLTIPDGVTSIDEAVFCFDVSLKSVNIPSGMTEIPVGMFYACTSLESIELPEGITAIGEQAFEGCASLANIRLWEPVRSIGPKAFAGCASLEAISFAGNIPTIADDSFGNVHGTVYYELDNPTWSAWDTSTVDHYGGRLASAGTSRADWGPIAYGPNWTFTTDGTLYIYDMGAIPDVDADAGARVPWYLHNDEIVAISVGAGVTSIGEGAFAGLPNLQTVTVGIDVTSIGEGAFANCSALVDVSLPDGLTSIGANAFAGCTALAEVEVPDSVTSMGDGCLDKTVTIRCSTGSAAAAYAKRSGNSTEMHTHVWGEPVWTWTLDGRALAQFTCQENLNHVHTLEASVTEQVLEEATYQKAGSKLRIAIVAFDGKTYSDILTMEIAKLSSPADTADSPGAIDLTPTKTKIKSAKNTGKKKITVKWKKNPTATGYQIQCSSSKTFAKGIKTVTVKKKGASKAKISKLKKGKTYYVRIRTMKTVGAQTYYSSWSAKKKVKVKR